MKTKFLLPFLICFTLILFIWALSFGEMPIDWATIFQKSQKAEILRSIIFEIRFARALMAFIAGGSLAICGAILQVYLRNPLADSAVLGISPFASLGAIIAIYFGVSKFSIWLVPLFAICFALFGLIIILLLASKAKSQTGIVLSGVVLSSFAGGLMALALNLAPNPYAIAEMIDWQIGSFNNVSFKEIGLLLPFLVFALAIFAHQSRFLNAIILGSETAQSLGFDVEKNRNLLIISVGVLAGAVTAFCGIIGFVGLIIPHIINRITLKLPSKSMVLNFISGGALTLCADNFTKIMIAQNELKVGVILTLIGAPFFLFILLKKGNSIA